MNVWQFFRKGARPQRRRARLHRAALQEIIVCAVGRAEAALPERELHPHQPNEGVDRRTPESAPAVVVRPTCCRRTSCVG